jgi:hypothetical protein
MTQARQRHSKAKVGAEQKAKDGKQVCMRACVMERQWW